MWNKTERAMKALRQQNEENGIKTVGNTEEEIHLEKGDAFSMTLAAFVTIMPAAIATLAVVVGIPVLILWLLSL